MVYPANLKDTLAFCRPSKEDIIASLLSEMFPESASCQPLSSISYKAEYFKYFAGCALGSQHWNEAFTKYLQSVPDPESWFYRLVIPYSDSFGWNYSYLWTLGIEHEPHEDTMNAFLKKLPLRKELSDDAADLLKLSSHNSQYLRKQDHGTTHVFLKHALKWYEDNPLNLS